MLGVLTSLHHKQHAVIFIGTILYLKNKISRFYKKKCFIMKTRNLYTPLSVFGDICGFGLWCLMPLSTIFQLYILWSVLLVEETGVPGEKHRSVSSH